MGKDLGGDDHLLAHMTERLSQYLFRVPVTVDSGRVKGGDARIKGRGHGPGGIGVLDAGPHGLAGLPGAQWTMALSTMPVFSKRNNFHNQLLPRFSFKAAWAAASRATGTRNGEHET